MRMLRFLVSLLPSLAGCAVSNGLECGDLDPNTSISACTMMIQSGEYRGRNLAGKLIIRGQSYVRVQQYERAIADFNRAITLAASDEASNWLTAASYDRHYLLLERADASFLNGDFEHSIADYSEAEQRYRERYPIAPERHVASGTWPIVFSRGKAYYLKGDRARAESDLARATELCIVGAPTRNRDAHEVFCRGIPARGLTEAAARKIVPTTNNMILVGFSAYSFK